MKKTKLLFAILILLGIIIFFSFNVFALNEHIKIDGSLRITIPPMEGNFHGRFLFTPIFIIESYGKGHLMKLCEKCRKQVLRSFIPSRDCSVKK